MSEYMEKHSVTRLIEAPPRYTGHSEGGQLTEINRWEWENNRFQNAVIIMTVNLGAGYLLSWREGKVTMQVARDRVMQEVKNHFSPDLLNRLDETVMFDPMSHEHLRKVAQIQLKNVAIRLAEKGVAMAVTNDALDYILATSYDPVYGARPITRWLER
ncbi:hypothetical protein AALP_AA1G204300 [Arabis alpina]|uniref:Clp ATPase C-terminal domain-containing protein n=1 Tax=Arabis alpina TaxID=50452 RepID=A0A087HPG5_ARAAL|nr:hypothetical protein AALP_AA1G204300 [Arabis alpina]